MLAWLCAVLLMFASAACAQVSPATTPGDAPLPTPQFRRYETGDGLPSGTIYAVAQDRNGLMWFGSAGGLVRFDGVSFKLFRHVLDDADALPANPVYALLVDRDNRVWTGGISTGLAVYDQRSGRFRQWVHDGKQAGSLASNEVWGLAQTGDGSLWVATEEGLDRMLPGEDAFEHVPLQIAGEPASSFGQTRALLADRDGRLWIGTGSGLVVREPDGSMQRVAVDPSFHGDVGKAWRIEGTPGDIRVSLTGGLLVIGADGVARPVADDELASKRIMSSTRDLQGRLWIGTADGVLLDLGDGRLQRFVGQPLLPGGLPGSKTWQTALDREGGLWITFERANVAYLPPGWNGFARFTHVPDDSGSLTDLSASAIHASSDGQLWVGGQNGWIDKLDVLSGHIRHLPQNMQGQIVSLTEDDDGRLWIDSPPHVMMLDRDRLERIDLGRAGVTRPVLLCAGERGRIYLASWNEGVFAIDADSRAVAPVVMAATGDEVLRPDQLTFHEGSLWYASEGGLLRRDDKDGRLHFVPGIPREEVLAFAFDSTGGFWLATWSALEHYRYVNGQAMRDDSIDFGHGRLDADVVDLQVDQLDRLWIFGNPGLWRFDRKDRHFASFGPSQGLLNANFDGGATARSPNGMLYAVNSVGVIAFRPDPLSGAGDGGAAPVLTRAGISVRRHGRSVALPIDSKVVEMGWRDSNLQVVVRLSSFINPDANRYRFRLNGLDADWVDADDRGERDFSSLPAGDYLLDVQAAGAHGPWIGLSSPVAIHVQSPPWMRWWAWMIYVLLLVAVVGWILRNWRRRLAQRHRMALMEQQREMAEAASAAKTQFLATLSHEIRTPMTGVMGMAELLLGTPLNPRQHDYARAMQRSGGMLLKLLDDSLDLARIESGKLELERAPFDPRLLLDEVDQLEQGLARIRHLHFGLDVADDLPPLLFGDALRIKQVLLNLVSNALKFTEHGGVTLSVRRLADGVLFSIRDTGPGIPEASQSRLFQRFEQEDGPQRRAGSGLGLAICRELVDLMGGSIELESRLGHGSTFHVRLPLGVPQAAAQPAVEPVHAGAGWRLLLVEDDAIVAAVILGLLEKQGHAVVHVVNGLAAMAELAREPFDAVLLDLDLPGVDGFQIARLIRQRESTGNHLPIVAVTARSGSEDEARAREAGMDGFLRKPLTGERLAEMLVQVLVVATA